MAGAAWDKRRQNSGKRASCSDELQRRLRLYAIESVVVAYGVSSPPSRVASCRSAFVGVLAHAAECGQAEVAARGCGRAGLCGKGTFITTMVHM